jgi:hypothetical protein
VKYFTLGVPNVSFSPKTAKNRVQVVAAAASIPHGGIELSPRMILSSVVQKGMQREKMYASFNQIRLRSGKTKRS